MIQIMNTFFELNLQVSNIDQSELKGKDFKVKYSNPSMLLILTSILRNSKSLKINIYSPILVSEEFYKLFDFSNPQVKYLFIEWGGISLYPVNKFTNNKWIFNEDLEDKELIEQISLSGYALFKFLLFSNLIYSVEEIEINEEFLTKKI